MDAHVFWCVLQFGQAPGIFCCRRDGKKLRESREEMLGIVCCLLFLLSYETGLDKMFCLLHRNIFGSYS